MIVDMVSSSSSSLLLRAANFAAVKHRGDRRKDAEATPYINHPIGVAHILIEEGGVDEPAVLAAALLHDTVEDTDATFEEIEANFGAKIRRIVEEVSDDKSLSYHERKRLQIEQAPNLSLEAKLVKLADKLYNLRDLERQRPPSWSEAKAMDYFIWAARVCDGLRGSNKALEERIDEVVKRNVPHQHN